MKKKRWKVAGVCVLIASVVTLAAFLAQKSERRKLDALVFAEMTKNPWDLNGDLLWGYYFTSSDKSPLERTAQLLKRSGYRVVDIRRNDETRLWWLHVEKIERHTLDSIAARNVRLAWCAKLCGDSTYDGWDVGQVPKAEKANQSPEPTSGLRPAVAHL